MSSQLQPLRDILINKKPPYCAGVLPVDAEELILYYGKSKDTCRQSPPPPSPPSLAIASTKFTCSRIDFLQATDEELQHLASACDPATFGLNQEDVLDETYRKAGKLDSAHFSTKLNVDSANSSIMDFVRFGLLQGHKSLRPIKAELYKLNVYGKDSFFKTHQDTPRRPSMFGSLVVVLPTRHEGGSLVLRHQEDEWTFDSAKEISVHSPESPHVAYIAFYGDVEHEVTMVNAGYRVTVTYNLYFELDNGAKSETQDPSGPIEGMLSSAFQSLLADPSFLPQGGHIGFGLRYKYPIDRKSSKADTLYYLGRCLKGSDAIIFKVCDELKLSAELKLLYKFRNFGLLLLDHEADIDGYYDEAVAVWEELINQKNAKVVERFDSYNKDDEKSVDFEVIWATDIKPYNRVEAQFVAAYGNEVTTNFVYGQFCIIVYVGPVGNRANEFEED